MELVKGIKQQALNEFQDFFLLTNSEILIKYFL